MARVAICLSVYNGEKYLGAQIDSILAQQGVDVLIWVRDDGSNDRTLQILNNFERRDSRVKVSSGENLGAARSFMRAVETMPWTADYYGFSDHDDVWLPDKLQCSVESMRRIEGGDIPCMVCSSVYVADQSLNVISATAAPRRGFCFRNAMAETAVFGATILFNSPAFDLLRSGIPRNLAMHDSWSYLLLSAFGRIYFDDRPRLLYRQHDSNLSGTAHSFAERYRRRLRRLTGTSRLWTQSCEFLRIFGDRLTDQDRKDLLRYVRYRNSMVGRIAFAINPPLVPQSKYGRLFIRVLGLLGSA